MLSINFPCLMILFTSKWPWIAAPFRVMNYCSSSGELGVARRNGSPTPLENLPSPDEIRLVAQSRLHLVSRSPGLWLRPIGPTSPAIPFWGMAYGRFMLDNAGGGGSVYPLVLAGVLFRKRPRRIER